MTEDEEKVNSVLNDLLPTEVKYDRWHGELYTEEQMKAFAIAYAEIVVDKEVEQRLNFILSGATGSR